MNSSGRLTAQGLTALAQLLTGDQPTRPMLLDAVHVHPPWHARQLGRLGAPTPAVSERVVRG
jgi:hypothetical protein